MPRLVRTEEGWSGGSSSGSELGGNIHGGRALARACSAEGEGGASERGRGAQASRPLPIGIGREEAHGNTGWGALRHGRHVPDTHRPLGHFTEYVVGSDVGKVGAVFGQIRADLDHGPKSKVVAHLMIYKTN